MESFQDVKKRSRTSQFFRCNWSRHKKGISRLQGACKQLDVLRPDKYSQNTFQILIWSLMWSRLHPTRWEKTFGKCWLKNPQWLSLWGWVDTGRGCWGLLVVVSSHNRYLLRRFISTKCWDLRQMHRITEALFILLGRSLHERDLVFL